jgi:hypothetical protein
VDTAEVAGAMSLEGLRGTPDAFHPALQRARPHPGQIASAERLRALLAGSEIRESHRHDDPRVQDAYALRCMPQVHGAARNAFAYIRSVLETEANSATDNPLIFPDEEGGAGRERRQLPRPAGGAGARPARHRPDRPRLDLGAAHGAAGEPRPLGPPRLPHPRPRRELRDDARPDHRRGAGQRVEGALPPGQRGLHPDRREQGGPRLHGTSAARKARQVLRNARRWSGSS